MSLNYPHSTRHARGLVKHVMNGSQFLRFRSEIILLLKCVRYFAAETTGNKLEENLSFRSKNSQWEALLRLSQEHRIRPFLGLFLKQREQLQLLPAEIRRSFEFSLLESRVLVKKRTEELENVLRLFREESINSFVPVKGTWLLKHVYQDRPYRTMNDIDLFLPRDEFALARRLLVDRCGFRPEFTEIRENALGKNCFKKDEMRLDLHWRELDWYWADNTLQNKSFVSYDPAEQYAHEREAFYQSYDVFSVEGAVQQLLLLWVHFLGFFHTRFVHLLDLLLLMEKIDVDGSYVSHRLRSMVSPAVLPLTERFAAFINDLREWQMPAENIFIKHWLCVYQLFYSGTYFVDLSLPESVPISNDGNKKTLYFILHIPKTGGKTIQRHIKEHREGTKCLFLYPPIWRDLNEQIPLARKLSPERKESIEIIMGHQVLDGLQSVFPREFRKIIFFREPVSRIISYYNHVRRFHDEAAQYSGTIINPTYRVLDRQGMPMSIIEWLGQFQDHLFLTVELVMTTLENYREIDRSRYLSIARNILNEFHFIGLTHQHEDYEIVFEMLGLPKNASRMNEKKKNYVSSDEQALVKEYVHEHMKEEIDLYSYACHLNTERKKKIKKI